MSRTTIAAAGIVFVLGVALCAPRIPWVYNITPSLPRGLYHLDRGAPVTVGDLVTFHLDKPVDDLARQRRYLPPRGQYQKYVVAEAGDRWCIQQGRFYVRGLLWAPVFDKDSQGRPLPELRGCQTVPDNHVLVATRHPRGFDSRYFGAVPRKHLHGRLTPVWISATSPSTP